MDKSDQFKKIKQFSGVKPVMDNFMMSVRITLTSITLITALIVSGVAMFVWIHLAQVPNLAMLENYNPGAELHVFDINDRPVCVFPAKEKRHVVPLTKVSAYAVKAVLAAEDHYFYEHQGVSLTGIARATLANISARRPVQGGSTLTQQLVKNLFYEGDRRTIPLKVAEGIVASEIERRYGKEKILEVYLNQIYFGEGAYGIEQAAMTYFGKRAIDLSAAESAFLAGLIRSPTRLGAPENREKAISRQKIVIDQMEKYGFISFLEAGIARSEQLFFKRAKNWGEKPFVPPHPYYLNFVAEKLRSSLSYNRHKGLKVYTNLDPKAQASAEAVFSGLKKRLPRGLDQAALVSIRLRDGAVVAMVGGLGQYLEHQWNCAVHPHTMGSSFKPFVYLSAFENGVVTPYSQISDSPLSVMDTGDSVWDPKNFDHKYMGMITVEEALAFSRNVCSVRIAQQVGIDKVIDTARRAGIQDELAPTLALSLGSSAASPLSMANAYATIARGGKKVTPRFIRRIDDDRGKTIIKFDPTPVTSLDQRATAQLVDVLRKVVASGTGTRARLSGIPVAGKTGTADDSKDLWFVGFTPDMVTAVWAGNSENKPVYGKHVTGGRVIAPIWRSYNTAYYRNHPKPQGTLVTDGGNAALPDRRKEKVEEAKTYNYVDSPYYTPSPARARSRPKRRKKPLTKKEEKKKGVTEYQWND